jgi:PAS domain S-box-containing protein
MQYIILVILASSMLSVLVVALSVQLKHKFIESRLETVEIEKVNYESIIEQANDAMFVIDIADGRVHRCNPSAAAMLGYSKKELEHKSLFELQPAHLLEKSSSTIADVWEKKGLIYKDIPFVSKTGELLPVECSAKVAPFAGRPSIVIYARDITERIKLENEIWEQKKIIEEKNRDITDSIQYSKRIQRSVFIDKDRLKELAPESFIFFRPKDIVSGDFYWFNEMHTTFEQENSEGNIELLPHSFLLFAAVDCTGHGVPGAFMSIIGNSLLNQAIKSPNVTTPAEALNYINTEIKQTLNQDADEAPIRDGMDIALCAIDFKRMTLEFSGANNPLYIVREKNIIEFKGDKQAITASSDNVIRPYVNQTVKLQRGDSIYIFTDGYADQFGGPLGKKFMYRRLKELLISLQECTMEEQMDEIADAFDAWKGELEQVDDVLVMGVKV